MRRYQEEKVKKLVDQHSTKLYCDFEAAFQAGAKEGVDALEKCLLWFSGKPAPTKKRMAMYVEGALAELRKNCGLDDYYDIPFG